MLIKLISKKIYNFMSRHIKVEPELKDVYIYGIEITVSTSLNAVTALCNMMKYLRDYRGFTKISSSLSTLYSKLWSLAGTSSSGSTSNGSESPAAKSYLQDLGYSASYGKYLFDWYSDFTRDINANKPILMSYGADFGGSEGGHCVFVVGYVETSDYQYLRVADGWNRTPRYLNYNGYNYTRRDGWAFSVS